MVTEYQAYRLLCASNKQSSWDCVLNHSTALLPLRLNYRHQRSLEKAGKSVRLRKPEGRKRSQTSLSLNYLLTNGVVWRPSSNTGE